MACFSRAWAFSRPVMKMFRMSSEDVRSAIPVVAVMMSVSYLGGLRFTNHDLENLFRHPLPQIGASYCCAWEKRFLWHFMAFHVWCAIFSEAYALKDASGFGPR